ncbi:MAG: hypothetical protein M1834_005398 [Cirrosporium novae-zelandiae]|nr:MAG: hypothetical protein M1834_005398 [Cirrosporium novae-zelandiae]
MLPSSTSGNEAGEGSSNQTGENHPRGAQRVKFSNIDHSRRRSKSPSGDESHGRRSGLIPSFRLPKRKHKHKGSASSIKHTSDHDADANPLQSSAEVNTSEIENSSEDDQEEDRPRLSAQTRALLRASLPRSRSPLSRRSSAETLSTPLRDPPSPPLTHSSAGVLFNADDIPLMGMGPKRQYNPLTRDDGEGSPTPSRPVRGKSTSEAHHLVRAMTGQGNQLGQGKVSPSGWQAGQMTPDLERGFSDYVERPDQYHGGILSSLLKLHQPHESYPMHSVPIESNPLNSRHHRDRSRPRPVSMGEMSANTLTATSSRESSGRSTPRHNGPKWYEKPANQSVSSLAPLINASTMIGGISRSDSPVGFGRPAMHDRSQSGGILDMAMHKVKPGLDDELRITFQIADILSRQQYLVKLCHALMRYGAPTHRLEECMSMTARALKIQGQFLYIPGCMIISLDDPSTHTAEVKLVKVAQGVDLGKLNDTHDIYKEVVHRITKVEEATQQLDDIRDRKAKFPTWLRVIVYGIASASVGPFAFKGRPIDMPIAFILGCILGLLQLVLAPSSPLYANVFEISAAVFTSFLARAFGSIYSGNNDSGDRIFCFSALTQSAISLILPGYTVLCGSLELQSKSIIAGSVRMVYAIIYSLFLAFGITIGTGIYGAMDANATSATTCPSQGRLNNYQNSIFAATFTLCLAIINQAKWKQVPVMVGISYTGYTVNYYCKTYVFKNTQIANTLAAFAIGVLGNLYSRFRHGVAAAAILPAIFVQVPSAISSAGSFVSGITSADQLTGNTNSTSSASTDSIFEVGYDNNWDYRGIIHECFGDIPFWETKKWFIQLLKDLAKSATGFYEGWSPYLIDGLFYGLRLGMLDQEAQPQSREVIC